MADQPLGERVARVSIPHRYSTNTLTVPTAGVLYPVSIPHRYSTNDHPNPRHVPWFVVSIPHRYSTNVVADLG